MLQSAKKQLEAYEGKIQEEQEHNNNITNSKVIPRTALLVVKECDRHAYDPCDIIYGV